MKSLKLLLLLLFVALPLTSSAVQQEAEKAKTIDELAGMYDVTRCKSCHAKIYEEWEKSLHAHSLIGTTKTMATLKNAITDGMIKEWSNSGIKSVEDIRIEHMMGCAKCHLPQLADASDAVARQIAKATLDGDTETLKKAGINCLICHNRNAIIHKWVYGEPEKDVIYGTKEGTHKDEKYKAIKKSHAMKESILCGQCHGLGPNFELQNPTQCATLYGSYLHAYVPAGGFETCQDCHMKKGNKGHIMPAYRDPITAKESVTVEVNAGGYQFLPEAGDQIPLAIVTIKMTNKAGHRIPDG